MTTDHQDYFEYLKQRSTVGYLYRRFWLYPQLRMQLRGKALDIGCGIGDMLSSRKNTVGVDINAETVAYCKQQGFEAHQMEIDVLPFEDGSFDSAILDNVLEHVPEPTKLLAEARRILRPDGVLVIGVPGEKGYQADADHKNFYDETHLKERLIQAGFRCTRMLRMPLPIPPLTRKLNSYCIYGVFELDGNSNGIG